MDYALSIIIKNPDDGNPLNKIANLSRAENFASVGFVLKAGDGNDYGQYIYIGRDSPDEDLQEAVSLILKTALQTKAAVEKGWFD